MYGYNVDVWKNKLNARCDAWSNVFKRIERNNYLKEVYNEMKQECGKVLESYDNYTIYVYDNDYEEPIIFKPGDKIVLIRNHGSNDPKRDSVVTIKSFYKKQYMWFLDDPSSKEDFQKIMMQIVFNGKAYEIDPSGRGFRPAKEL